MQRFRLQQAKKMAESPIVARSVVPAVLSLLLSCSAIAQDDEAFTRDHEADEIEWGPCPDFMPESCNLAVLQGDPEEMNVDVLFRLRSGTTAPHHWHTSAERMVLLTGEMSVNYDNQEPVVLESGNYAYGPPALPHVATCQSQEDCVLFIAFNEPVDAFAVAE